MKLLKVQSVGEVLSIINGKFQPIDRYQSLELTLAFGRVLGDDILAPESIPDFPRSSVDGYALIAEETYGASETLPTFLKVLEEIKMGQEAQDIGYGETRYIPTGGMLPPNANAIVMVEYTEELNDQVMVYRQVVEGENIIKAGDDISQGEIVLKKGTVLREGQISALAALGISKVKVYDKPLVGILSTGNELVDSSSKELQLGQIRDTNSIGLAAIAQKYGAKVIHGGIAKDQLSEIIDKAGKLLDQVDVLLLSGGSSVGTLDFTDQVIKALSTEETLVEGIAVRPGKPTLLAKSGKKALWGLPGHPVSAMMIFNYFGGVLLSLLNGSEEVKYRKGCRAKLTRNIPSSAGRTDWVMIKIHEESKEYYASPVFGKSSLIKTLTESHGYVEVPANKEGLEEGTLIEVVLWE